MDGDVVWLCGIQREQRCELITKGTCGVRRDCCLGLGKIPDFGQNLALSVAVFELIHQEKNADYCRFFLPNASVCGALAKLSLGGKR